MVGRLKVVQGLLFGIISCVGTASYALPLDPARLASELKMNDSTVRVKLSNLGRILDLKGTDLGLSLAMKPELGNVRADEWIIDCKKSEIFQPSTSKSRQIPRSGVLIESLSGILSINGKRFREQIVIYPKELLSPYDASERKNPECLVVNHINIEKYLESVVNGEFNSQWAESAVEAQIIAARTYALFQMKQMRKDRGRVFDVESTERDQVYLGLDRADLKGSELVLKTKGLIMTAKRGKKFDPIKAFYHASCGGRTSLPQSVWGAKFPGFTKRVPCPYCSHAPSFNWEARFSFYELEKKIAQGMSNDQNAKKILPKSYVRNPNLWILNQVTSNANASSRDERNGLLQFDFIDRDNSSKHLKFHLSASMLRTWLDPVKFKSTLFNLTAIGRSIVFHGKGSGHGVGMCQWGAKRMGEKGFSTEQILTYYYPDVKITRIIQ